MMTTGKRKPAAKVETYLYEGKHYTSRYSAELQRAKDRIKDLMAGDSEIPSAINSGAIANHFIGHIDSYHVIITDLEQAFIQDENEEAACRGVDDGPDL